MALWCFACFFVVIFIRLALNKRYQYFKTTYYRATQHTHLDTGQYGEYLIYDVLKHFEQFGGQFLFNLYLPKSGNQKTEIDVLLIYKHGLFVFESKNYSGWIFGDERQSKWTQVLPSYRGRACYSYFYNPIRQNKNHIKYLKRLIGSQIPIHSIVVFSDRCTFKDITVINPDTYLIHRRDLIRLMDKICSQTQPFALSQVDIDALLQKLSPYTQIPDHLKVEHAQAIRDTMAK